MTDITKTSGNMPTIPDDYAERLLAGVAATRAAMSTGGGGDLLRMERGNGQWVFGAASEEVQEGSRWLVNPTMFAHGWICWIDPKKTGQTGKSRKGGEIMASMADPLPPEPPPVDGKHPYERQYGAALKCMEGTDEGQDVVYKSNSMGGTEGMAALIDQFRRHFQLDRDHPCPVVTLQSTFYMHPSYGKTFKPVFNVVGWADMNGTLAGEKPAAVAKPAEEPEPPTPPKPARQRKAPLGAAQEPLQTVQEPQPTQQVHVGQRRRPAAR